MSAIWSIFAVHVFYASMYSFVVWGNQFTNIMDWSTTARLFYIIVQLIVLLCVLTMVPSKKQLTP